EPARHVVLLDPPRRRRHERACHAWCRLAAAARGAGAFVRSAIRREPGTGSNRRPDARRRPHVGCIRRTRALADCLWPRGDRDRGTAGLISWKGERGRRRPLQGSREKTLQALVSAPAILPEAKPKSAPTTMEM